MASSRLASSSSRLPRIAAALHSSPPVGPVAGLEQRTTQRTFGSAAAADGRGNHGQGGEVPPPISSWRYGVGAAICGCVAASSYYLYGFESDSLIHRDSLSHFSRPSKLPVSFPKPRPNKVPAKNVPKKTDEAAAPAISVGGPGRPDDGTGNYCKGQEQEKLAEDAADLQLQELQKKVQQRAELELKFKKLDGDQAMIQLEKKELGKQRKRMDKDLLKLERDRDQVEQDKLTVEKDKVRVLKEKIKLEKENSKNKLESLKIKHEQEKLERENLRIQEENVRIAQENNRINEEKARIEQQKVENETHQRRNYYHWLSNLDLRIDNILKRVETVIGLPNRLVLLKQLAIENRKLIFATVVGWYNSTAERFHEPFETNVPPEPPADYFG